MIFFCNSTYTIMTGMTMIVTDAAINPKSVPYWELICSNSVEIGYLVGSVSYTHLTLPTIA